jgi:uncharacterized protein
VSSFLDQAVRHPQQVPDRLSLLRESHYNVWVDDGDCCYVFNGVSGALLEVPRGTRLAVTRVLDDVAATGCSPALLERMAYGRMLVSDDADELAMLARRYRVSQDDTSHFAYTLVPSLGCNFECTYCFEDKHPSVMSRAVQDALVSVLDERLPTLRDVHVTWFGGEPLVATRALLDLSDRFIAACDAADVRYDAGIITNGYLLDERTCRELRDRRVGSAQVTLDGPPEVHDRMRPRAGGRPSFGRIVENLGHAVSYLDVIVRMNVDAANVGRAEELLATLEEAGLAGKVGVYVGQIVGVDDGSGAPSSTYGTRCLTGPEFAATELDFSDVSSGRGFGQHALPQPVGAPCTAVRRNELVVGSEGELYKCWESVGNRREVIGSIFDVAASVGTRQERKWLAYDPFSDDECTSCVALPVCMGGCANHALDLLQRSNRCSTFRHSYVETVRSYARGAAAQEPS